MVKPDSSVLSTQPGFPAPREPAGGSDLVRKVAAVLEIAGVLVAGNVIAFKLIPLLGIKPIGPAFESALSAAKPDFVSLSTLFFLTKAVQYGCLLMLAFAVGWWRRRLGPRHYGVTTAGQPVRNLVVTGIVAFALVAFPVKILWLARRFLPLGEGSPFWALLEKDWTWSFWLIMAVASFAFQPVIEELLFRGYCQTRLEEDFGGIGAVFVGALFFVLGHDQYHHLSVMSLGTIITLTLSALGLGFVYWRTRSLVPGVIFHAALNVPTKGIYDFLLPAAMLAVVVCFRQAWLNWLADFGQQAATKGWRTAAVLGTVLLSGMMFGFERWQNVFAPVALLGLVAALVLEFPTRRVAMASRPNET